MLEKIKKTPGEFGPMVHNTVNHRWRIHLFRGFAFYRTNERKKAVEELTRAFDLCDNNSEYFKLLAPFYMENYEFSEAEWYLFEALGPNQGDKGSEKQSTEKLLVLDSHNIEIFFSLANLYLKKGRLADSIALYEKILGSNTAHPGALINLGNALRRKGTPVKAIPYLEKAVEASPLSIEANSNLAYAYYETENFDSAG